MEFCSLLAPWLFLFISVWTVVLLICRKWKFAVVGLLIAILGIWYFEVLPLNRFRNKENKGITIKVLLFNCKLSPRETDYYNRVADVAHLIDSIDVDVVFLTENYYCKFDTLYHIIQSRYPYRTNSLTPTGNRIYSKFEIKADTAFKSKECPYGITYVQTEPYGQLLNIFGCHLSSNNYNEHHEYMTPDSVENSQQSRAYIRNVMDASGYREMECKEILNLMNGIERPCIVMGDMNDVAGSPTIRVLAKLGFKDAWWEKGLGYGATIHKSLPYRIDHVLYGEGLWLKSIKKINPSTGLGTRLNDHDALVAEFSSGN